MERRLGKLEAIYRRPTRRAKSLRLDLSALSQDEILELDDLLREPARHQNRTGVASYAMLSPAAMARLEHVWSRVKEIA